MVANAPAFRRLFVLAGLPFGVSRSVKDRLGLDRNLAPADYVEVPFQACRPRYDSVASAQLLSAVGDFLRARLARGKAIRPRPTSIHLLFVPCATEGKLLAEFDFFVHPVRLDERDVVHVAEVNAIYEEIADVVLRIGRQEHGFGHLVRAVSGQGKKRSLLTLPPRNFALEEEATLDAEFRRIRTHGDWEAMAITPTRFLREQLPKAMKKQQPKAWFYQDARGRVFPPDLRPHGVEHGDWPAEPTALRTYLSSLFRFGVRMTDGAHDDVQFENRNFDAERFFCSTKGELLVNGTHVNVYPNDFVREEPGKK